MVLAPFPPAMRLTLAGVAESVKVGGAATVRAIVALVTVAPALPVTVTAQVPGAAFPAALNVSVVVRVAFAGLNVAVTPAGSPAIEKATKALKPPCGATEIVLPALPPGATLRVAGDAAIVKPVAAPSVRLIVAVFRRLPDVPLMVMMERPSAAEADAVSVSVLAPSELAALKDAMTPLGSPDAARATVPANPFCGLMTTVPVIAPPGLRIRLAGVTEMENAGDDVTATAILTMLVWLPEVPVIVAVDVAGAAELPADSVSVLVVMALAGLNDPVTPAGNPVTARFTAPLKPCCEFTVMVLLPLAPGTMESVGVDEDRLNAGGFGAPVKLLIRGWPAGLPHPVARSYPGSALKPLFPVMMSCRSLWKLEPAPML